MKNTSGFMRVFKAFLKKTADCLFPPQCPYCGKVIPPEQTLCDSCFHKITFIHPPRCHRCSLPLPAGAEAGEKTLCAGCLAKRPAYDIARSAFVYDNFSRRAVLKFKYHDRTDLRHVFVHYLLQAGADLFDKTDIVIPVPMFWARRLKRRYNQAAVLAELLARKIHKPCAVSVLSRARRTEPQTGKNAKDRHKNLVRAFRVKHAEKIQNKTVLLIDDVLTTGATAEACAQILKKNKAKAVYVLTIARSVKQ